MSTNLILTVAIPTFNGGSALLEAVASCRNIILSYNEFEVLLVDNCSYDGSIEEVERQFIDFKPIRIVRNDNNYGRIGNWNRCLDLASGEFILYLFTNDLIAKENNIGKAIDLLKHNDECSLVSVPWFISDYKMSDMSLPPQFFLRSPRNGYYNSEIHIKSVVETGKLPFVCLQANLLRKSLINERKITFNTELPISSDGVFLSELAMQTGVVGFYDKPSVIWRSDAPNRLHGQIKWNEHARQNIEAFSLINSFLKEREINLTKACSQYNGLGYFFFILVSARTLKDIAYSIRILSSWVKAAKRININGFLFFWYIFITLVRIPLKFKTLFTLLRNRLT